MKKLVLLPAILISLFAYAQKWDSVGAPFRYNEGCGCYLGMACFATYNGQLYSGGNANNGNVNGLGIWNGTNWSIPGTGLQGQIFVGVDAMTEYNGSLYVGGYFLKIGGVNGVNNIAAWNGASWSKVNGGISVGGFINAMFVYNGDLYVAGKFDSAGGIKVNNIARFNGSVWSAVGLGLNSTVQTVAEYNGNLVAGGYFDSAGGKPASNIAQWNGSTWSAIGGGTNRVVNALTPYNSYLIVGGLFDSVGGKPAKGIVEWDGTAWHTMGKGLTGNSYYTYGAYSLLTANTMLYVGGFFDSANGMPANSVVMWNGTTWMPMGNGVKHDPNYLDIDGTVYGLAYYNNGIYAAGTFDTAGTEFTGCIAKWNSPLGVNEITEKSSVAIYPNPSHGVFNLAISNVQLGMKNTVEVYNMLGEEVYCQYSNFTTHFSIDISNNPAGIYLYRVLTEAGTLLGEGKLIKE